MLRDARMTWCVCGCRSPWANEVQYTGLNEAATKENDILQVKYLNNIIEQDHRFVKRITAPMLGFKAFYSADATLAGIETAHMIRKGQLDANGLTAFQQFAALAA
jgi:transposase-like protein